MPSPIQIYTDRSRCIRKQKCPRERYLGTHFDGIGLDLIKLRIPLIHGSIVHKGLDRLLSGMELEAAIQATIKDYWDAIKKRGIQLEPGEEESRVADEQTALAEGQLRAYAKRKLKPLLEQFEVLETEHEDVWKMYEWAELDDNGDLSDKRELMFMARADALLLERCSNDLYIQSFKTAAQYDKRAAKEAEHDVQGLSEVASVEVRLAEWWKIIQDAKANGSKAEYGLPKRMIEFLREQPSAPKIAGVRMEYLIKGKRMEYPEDSGVWVTYSPLIRGYVKYGVTGGDDQFGWKREYRDEMGVKHRLDYRTWKAVEMWKQNGGVKAWIELLDTGTVQPEAGDCLEQQFVTPVPYFRQDDDLRDWYEQTVVEEMEVAKKVEETERVRAEFGVNSPQFRSTLNRNFPQYRRSCDWPSSCSMIDICYGTNVKADPIGSGLYQRREPHHRPEAELVKISAATKAPSKS